MSTTTFGWLIILCPLVGCIVIGAGFRRERGLIAGWIGTLAIFLSFAFAVGALISLLGHAEDSRELTSSLWNYAFTVGVDAKLEILVDPLSVLMALIVSGVSALIHLYSVAYLKSDRGYSRFFAYLNFFVFSMLLLVLAGNFLVLIVGLGVRRRRLVHADLVLVPPHDRHQRRAKGIRDQCDRRRRAGARHVLHLPPHRHGRLRQDVPVGAARVRPQQHRSGRRVSAAAPRGVREIRPGAAAHMVARRDGGPDPRLGADPRRDDGDRRRLPARAHAHAVRARARPLPT